MFKQLIHCHAISDKFYSQVFQLKLLLTSVEQNLIIGLKIWLHSFSHPDIQKCSLFFIPVLDKRIQIKSGFCLGFCQMEIICLLKDTFALKTLAS